MSDLSINFTSNYYDLINKAKQILLMNRNSDLSIEEFSDLKNTALGLVEDKRDTPNRKTGKGNGRDLAAANGTYHYVSINHFPGSGSMSTASSGLLIDKKRFVQRGAAFRRAAEFATVSYNDNAVFESADGIFCNFSSLTEAFNGAGLSINYRSGLDEPTTWTEFTAIRMQFEVFVSSGPQQGTIAQYGYALYPLGNVENNLSIRLNNTVYPNGSLFDELRKNTGKWVIKNYISPEKSCEVSFPLRVGVTTRINAFFTPYTVYAIMQYPRLGGEAGEKPEEETASAQMEEGNLSKFRFSDFEIDCGMSAQVVPTGYRSVQACAYALNTGYPDADPDWATYCVEETFNLPTGLGPKPGTAGMSRIRAFFYL
jgi:hypothetical protein